MLTAAEALHVERRRRPRPSLRQQYDEYILQRIESYKNAIPRDELMRLGDEAAAGLHSGAEGQFVLTEILMLDSVDDLIKRRLKLKSFKRWKDWVRSLRDAQREPTHWGIEPECPLVGLLRRVEACDQAVVIGPGTEGAACLLAAHEMAVTYLATDFGSIDRLESRCDGEALSAGVYGYCVGPDFRCLSVESLPDEVAVAVLDSASVGEIEPASRAAVIAELQARTTPNGVHVLLPGGGLAPEALLCHYDGWAREEVGRPRRRGARSRGIVLAPPPAQSTHEAGGVAAI
jgi:hypothetical protein